MSSLSRRTGVANAFWGKYGIVLFAIITALAQPSRAEVIPLTSSHWEASGDVLFQRDPVMQEVLVVNKGYAELKDRKFSNGTIEFDTKFSGGRITGITFRQHDDAADALYFRPSADCAISQECIQYMPTAHHLFEWDLYGQYQTHAPINPSGWNHVKLVLSGARMNVFINGASTPTLAVGTLVGGFSDGAIRLHGPSTYANLSISPNVTEGLTALAVTDSAEQDNRYLRHWLASKPFAMPSRMDAALQEKTGIDPTFLSRPRGTAAWMPIPLDPGGLINLTRWYGDAQKGPDISGIWLKTTINADRDLTKHVSIGWTREVWIFVNGKRVFEGKNLYGVEGMSKPPGGRLSLSNGSFDLPLKKGENTVLVTIDDNFAGGQQHWGWGLEARMDDAEGVHQNGDVATTQVKKLP